VPEQHVELSLQLTPLAAQVMPLTHAGWPPPPQAAHIPFLQVVPAPQAEPQQAWPAPPHPGLAHIPFRQFPEQQSVLAVQATPATAHIGVAGVQTPRPQLPEQHSELPTQAFPADLHAIAPPPSSPHQFSPQHETVPSSDRLQLWYPCDATCTALAGVLTAMGALAQVDDRAPAGAQPGKTFPPPSPSWLAAPQQKTEPSLRTAQAWP